MGTISAQANLHCERSDGPLQRVDVGRVRQVHRSGYVIAAIRVYGVSRGDGTVVSRAHDGTIVQAAHQESGTT